MSRKKFKKIQQNIILAVHAIMIVFACEEVNAKSIHWVNNEASTYVPPGTNCSDAGHSTIQSAVNASAAGDTINVCPGTYNENIVITTNNLKLISIAGAAATTVNAAISSYVFLIGAPNVTIDGFKIVPAGSGDLDLGINLAVEGNAKATIVRNVLIGGRIGINLGCASANSTVPFNIVDGQSGSGINIDTCEGSNSGSDGNLVHHNTSCGGIFSYSIVAGGKSDNNNIHHNAAMWLTVAAHWKQSASQRR